MHLIVVTDIFGRTRSVEELVSELVHNYSSVEILDPFEGKDCKFISEKEAYTHFQEVMGLSGYIDHLRTHLKRTGYDKQHLLGFSVGGSAVWAVSEKERYSSETRGFCFYSSQIRNLLDVEPQFEIDLLFARKEQLFNVDAVMNSISLKQKVRCCKTQYLHGFMNRKSTNFSIAGYNEYLALLKGVHSEVPDFS